MTTTSSLFSPSSTLLVQMGISSNTRQPFLHAFLYALYPMYALFHEKEQRKILMEVMEQCAFALDKNNFYERNKMAHFAKKAELQNKFLLYADVSNDAAMQRVLVNFFDVNILTVPNTVSNMKVGFEKENEIQLVPNAHNFVRKGTIVLQKRLHKFYPFLRKNNDHNLISLLEFVETTEVVRRHKTRQKYKLAPFYKYKIEDLITTAKQFHITTTKPGRYNRLVNKTKKELYQELKIIL